MQFQACKNTTYALHLCPCMESYEALIPCCAMVMIEPRVEINVENEVFMGLTAVVYGMQWSRVF